MLSSLSYFWSSAHSYHHPCQLCLLWQHWLHREGRWFIFILLCVAFLIISTERQGCMASAGLLSPQRSRYRQTESAWKGMVCSGVGPPRQLLVSSVIVKNQEQSLSLVICSSSVTNFSSMGHLVWLWMMALAKWHRPDGGVNRSDAGTGALDPACVFRELLKEPVVERNVRHAWGLRPYMCPFTLPELLGHGPICWLGNDPIHTHLN